MKTKKYPAVASAMTLIATSGLTFAEIPDLLTTATLTITASTGTVFSLDTNSSFVWASASSVFVATDCGCGVDIGVDVDIDAQSAETTDGGSGCFTSGVTSDSFSYLSHGSNSIIWNGIWFAESSLADR